MNLVRADDEVVLSHQSGQPLKFSPIKDARQRVVRIAEQQNLGVRLRTGGFEFFPIKSPAPVDKDHLELERIAF